MSQARSERLVHRLERQHGQDGPEDLLLDDLVALLDTSEHGRLVAYFTTGWDIAAALDLGAAPRRRGLPFP